MKHPALSLAMLGIAATVATASWMSRVESPQQVLAPPVTVAPSVVGEATGGVLENLPPTLTNAGGQAEHGSRVEKPAVLVAPQAVAVAAQQSPAAGGFCPTGNCGPAQSRRVFQVQRPQRSGLFGGRIFRGRR